MVVHGAAGRRSGRATIVAEPQGRGAAAKHWIFKILQVDVEAETGIYMTVIKACAEQRCES